MLVEDNSNTTTSSSASPPKSQNANGNEFWWTERMVLRAQEEFPNELGSKWSEYVAIKFSKMKKNSSSHRVSIFSVFGAAKPLAVK